MRIALEMLTAVAGAATIFNVAFRYWLSKRGSKSETNVEHVRRLEEENKEIDKINQRITKGHT